MILVQTTLSPHTYAQRLWVATSVLVLSLLLSALARAQGERCGVAKDFVVQALERVKTGATAGG